MYISLTTSTRSLYNFSDLLIKLCIFLIHLVQISSSTSLPVAEGKDCRGISHHRLTLSHGGYFFTSCICQLIRINKAISIQINFLQPILFQLKSIWIMCHILFLKTLIWFQMFQKVCMSHSMTKPTKWPVRPAKTQISLDIRPVWSESLLCALWIAKDPVPLQAETLISLQSGRMPRLTWVFPGHTSFCWFCHDMAHI